MTGDCLLGIDIGTSACKGAVFSLEGELLCEGEAGYEIERPRFGWAQQSPQEWWQAVCDVLENIAARGFDLSRVAAVGVSGQSWAMVPLDTAGNVLYPSPIWLDNRAQDICEAYTQCIDPQEIHELSGNLLRPAYTLPKLLWLREREPELFARIDKVLQSNSYIVYRLTGRATQDVSQGYAYQFFDIRALRWNEKMADRFHFPLELLPDLMPCHGIAGEVTGEAARQTGLRKGTPVVAGGLDATSTALGCGVCEPGQTQEQGGTSGGVGICLKEYAHDARLIMSAHIVPGRWLLQGGTVGGGSSLKWFEKEFCAQERAEAKERRMGCFARMDELAGEIPPGSDGLLYLPYMAGERSPIWDTKASGVFFGMDFSKKRAHFIRAVMEGVAYTARHNMQVAQSAGLEIGDVYAGGGATKSPLWMQIKADVTGRPFYVPAGLSASALGAAMLAGVGAGMYRDFPEAVARCVEVKQVYTPDEKAHDVYTKGFEIYLDLYEALRETMQKAGEMR